MSEWISVDDGLPKTEDDYLVVEKYPKFLRMSLGLYVLNTDTLKMQWQTGQAVSTLVTHWMPRPPFPETP